MRCLAAAAHFLIRKKLFNTKYPQLLVAKDFAVAVKKLHLTVSGRKYDPGKKAPKKRRTSDVKTADPKPSTSQNQPQDESVSEQPQGASTSEHQPQGEASTSTQQEPVPSQFSNDDTLPDVWTMARKVFATKDPRSIPKKPKYIIYNRKQITFNPLCLIFSLQIKRKMIYTLNNSRIVTKCQVLKKFFNLPFTKIMYLLKMYLFSFQYQSNVQLTVFLFFQFAFINTFNELFIF